MPDEQPLFRVFRNRGNRIFYLRPRTDQGTANFLFGPGETLQAMDAQEDAMLATISMDIVDVAKEAPSIGKTMDSLRQQLAEERAKNESLKTERDALAQQVAKVGRQVEARQVAPLKK